MRPPPPHPQVWDVRRLGGGPPRPCARIPNAPSFAGAVSPVGALHLVAAGPGGGGLLLSGSVAWWTPDQK